MFKQSSVPMTAENCPSLSSKLSPGVRVKAPVATTTSTAVVRTRSSSILRSRGRVGRRRVALTWRIVVHAFVCVSTSALLLSTSVALTSAVTASAVASAASSAAAAAAVMLGLLLLEATVEALASTALLIHHLLLHLLLHLLHLLHLLGVHVVGAAATHHLLLHLLHLHHLLHHLRVHLTHAPHCHLALHHGEVLLHALEVLSHNLRGHAVAHALSHTRPLVVALELVALSGVLFFAEVAPRLGLLDLDGLPVNLKRNVDTSINTSFAFEGNESKAARPACILVHHKGSVDNTAELCKVFPKLLIRGILADATNENLAGLLLFIARNSTLGVDLNC